MTPPFHAFRISYALVSLFFLLLGLSFQGLDHSDYRADLSLGGILPLVFVAAGLVGFVVSILPSHVLTAMMQLTDRLLQ